MTGNTALLASFGQGPSAARPASAAGASLRLGADWQRRCCKLAWASFQLRRLASPRAVAARILPPRRARSGLAINRYARPAACRSMGSSSGAACRMGVQRRSRTEGQPARGHHRGLHQHPPYDRDSWLRGTLSARPIACGFRMQSGADLLSWPMESVAVNGGFLTWHAHWRDPLPPLAAALLAARAHLAGRRTRPGTG